MGRERAIWDLGLELELGVFGHFRYEGFRAFLAWSFLGA